MLASEFWRWRGRPNARCSHCVQRRRLTGPAAGITNGALTVALNQGSDDDAGLGNHQHPVGDVGSSAQRVNGAQFRRSHPGVGIALTAVDVMRHAQLFKQPPQALRAAAVEVAQCDHGEPIQCGDGRRNGRHRRKVTIGMTTCKKASGLESNSDSFKRPKPPQCGPALPLCCI